MPEKKLNIRGVEWEYTAGGSGPRTLLMFHGAVGGGETMQWLAQAFGDEYRTIAPTIAPVARLAEVCDAASAILDREHVGRAVVFGGSFGGMLAQAFVRRHPRQAEHLILLSTGAPTPSLGSKNEKLLRVFSLLPFALVRALMKLELAGHLRTPPGAPADAAGRVAAFRERLDDYFERRLTKEVFRTRVALSVDFNKNEDYSPRDLSGWPGRVLIVESADDPMIAPEERLRLRAAYPRAVVCTFEGAGHMIPLLRFEELVGVLRGFLGGECHTG